MIEDPMIEPILIGLMGLVVGGIVIALFMPILHHGVGLQ